MQEVPPTGKPSQEKINETEELRSEIPEELAPVVPEKLIPEAREELMSGVAERRMAGVPVEMMPGAPVELKSQDGKLLQMPKPKLSALSRTN